MVGHGGSSAGSYLSDPTSPIPSHCASIVATSTVRVNYDMFLLQLVQAIVRDVTRGKSANVTMACVQRALCSIPPHTRASVSLSKYSQDIAKWIWQVTQIEKVGSSISIAGHV